jgi:hypothetical protein
MSGSLNRADCLQLHKRTVLLGYSAGNRKETSRRNELLVHSCTYLRSDDEYEGLRAT